MKEQQVDRKAADRELVYQLEGRPRLRTALPLGLQHVLAMFASNLAPILIIAGACGLAGADTVIMVQCAMFVSGLTTFIQLYPPSLASIIKSAQISRLSWAPRSRLYRPRLLSRQQAESARCWAEACSAA